MRPWVRIPIVVAVAVAAGFLTAHLVIARAGSHGAAAHEVRLAGAMAGLFAAGIAAVVLGLALFLPRRRGAKSENAEP